MAATLTAQRDAIQEDVEVVTSLLKHIDDGKLEAGGSRMTGAQIQRWLGRPARFAKQGAVANILAQVGVVPTTCNRFYPYQIIDAVPDLRKLLTRLKRDLAIL